MQIAYFAACCLFVFCLSFAGTACIRQWLLYCHILDHPNARSNHTLPTPRGGGIAVFLSIVAGMLLLSPNLLPVSMGMLAGGAALAAISFMDDRRGVSIRWRLLVQIGAVLAGLLWMGDGVLVFQGWLPLWLDKLVTGFLWLWFINLYNFMDGIDGITGMETICITAGIALIALMGGGALAGYGYMALVVGLAAAGFLVWNWHPAKIFLGDVGSIPLGYFVGWLLIGLAGEGYWAAALLLPAYYLADSGLTLLKRILRKEKFWQAHSQHFYQKAVRGGLTPPAVVGRILLVNIVLLVFAWYSMAVPVLSLGLALVVVPFLLWWLSVKRCHSEAESRRIS